MVLNVALPCSISGKSDEVSAACMHWVNIGEASIAVTATNKRRKLDMMEILNIDVNDIKDVDSIG